MTGNFAVSRDLEELESFPLRLASPAGRGCRHLVEQRAERSWATIQIIDKMSRV